MSNIRKAFRTTKVKVTAFPKDVQDNIEMLFLGLEASKTDAVDSERLAGIAVAKATQKRMAAQIAELELLRAASNHSNQIAGERVWTTYRDAEGVITFEGITERLMRNNFRAQQEMIGRQLSENSDEEVNRDGLYENGEEDEDNQEPAA